MLLLLTSLHHTDVNLTANLSFSGSVTKKTIRSLPAASIAFGPATARVQLIPTGATYAHHVLADGPLAYWKLNEALGSDVALDSSGNLFDMTVNTHSSITLGEPSFMLGDSTDTTAASTGDVGWIASQSMVMAAVTNTNGQSLELWVNYTQKGAYDDVFALAGTGVGHLDRWNVDGKSYPSHFMNTRINAFADVPLQGIHYMVWTRIQGGNFIFYLDGVQKATGTSNAFGVPPVFYAGGNGVGIATTGSMAHVAIYNKVLTPAQIADHYLTGLATFVQILSGSETARGRVTPLHWYTGVFKFASHGLVRSVYRIRNLITQDRNLT